MKKNPDQQEQRRSFKVWDSTWQKIKDEQSRLRKATGVEPSQQELGAAMWEAYEGVIARPQGISLPGDSPESLSIFTQLPPRSQKDYASITKSERDLLVALLRVLKLGDPDARSLVKQSIQFFDNHVRTSQEQNENDDARSAGKDRAG